MTTTLTLCMKRIDAARVNREPPEVMYELMRDAADAVAGMGVPDIAAKIRSTAATMTPMFGMQADFDRRQLPRRKRKTWTPPNYRARADLYRSDIAF